MSWETMTDEERAEFLSEFYRGAIVKEVTVDADGVYRIEMDRGGIAFGMARPQLPTVSCGAASSEGGQG